MNKKIIFILFWIIPIFFTLNSKNILWNYYFLKANHSYNSNNFSWALVLYNDSEKYLTWANLDYNIWNTYYKIWEKLENLDNKINYYNKSLNNYLKLVRSNQFKEDVVYNYKFVKKKLDELEKQKKEKDKKQKEEQVKQQDKQKDKEKEDLQENKKEQDKKKSNSWDDKQNDNSKKNNDKSEVQNDWSELKISPQEIQQISEYIEKLNDEEKYNRQFYNNSKKSLNNQLLENINGSEKDW